MVTLMLVEQVSPAVRWSVLHDAEGNGTLGGGWLLSWFAGKSRAFGERTSSLTEGVYFVYNLVAPRRRTGLNAH